jgi:hypothetical protein
VGGALLLDWGFPRSIAEPVRWQYSPRSSASQAKMAITLHVAKWLRTTVCAPRAAIPLPEDAHLRALSLTMNTLAALTAEVSRRIAAVSSLLDSAADDTVARKPLFPANGDDWKI